MKLSLYILISVLFCGYISGQGVNKYGQNTTTGSDYVSKNGKITDTPALTRYGQQLIFPNCGTVTDVDGNIYNTVIIGSQCWLQENLKTTKFNDSTSIPMATDMTVTWSNVEEPIFCWYNFDPGFKDIYGALYNIGVVVSRKACPVGWHVSSNTDWTNMLRILDPTATTYHKESSFIAGGGLKSTGTLEGGNGLWHAPNTGATNVLGFSGIPGGYVNSGSFTGMGYFGVWWLLFEIRVLNYNSIAVGGAETSEHGYSIRCVKD